MTQKTKFCRSQITIPQPQKIMELEVLRFKPKHICFWMLCSEPLHYFQWLRKNRIKLFLQVSGSIPFWLHFPLHVYVAEVLVTEAWVLYDKQSSWRLLWINNKNVCNKLNVLFFFFLEGKKESNSQRFPGMVFKISISRFKELTFSYLGIIPSKRIQLCKNEL